MKKRLALSAIPYLLAGLLFAALSFAQNARAGDAPECGRQGKGFMPGMPGAHEAMDMPPPFADLELNEKQQKEIAAVMQTQHKALQAKQKTVHETRQALQALAEADSFDSAKAQTLAEAHGKASAELAFLHAQTQAKIRALLSPEQRQRLAEHEPQTMAPMPPRH